MTTVLTKARSRRAGGRAGDTARDLVAAQSPARSGMRRAIGELPLVNVTDAHGPIINLRLPDAADIDYSRRHLSEVARTHELCNACMRIRADRLIKPPIVVERTANGDDWELIPHHPLLDLLRMPGETLETSAFWRFVSMSWDGIGAVYLEPLFDNGMLAGVNPLDPQYITERYTPTGMPDYYEWNPGYGAVVRFGPNELIVRRRLNDIDPAPLVSALAAVEADLAFSDYIRSFFFNSGIPSGMIKIHARLSKEQSDVVKATWIQERGHGGVYQGAPIVLGEDADYIKIGSAIGELDNETVRELLESRICMPFGVPPIVIYSFFGLRHGTYSNVEEAWNSFWETTVATLLGEWGDWLTRALLPYYEGVQAIMAGRVRARFDTSGIPAMQEDRGPNVAMQKDAFDQGVISVNERREGMGMPRLEDALADEVEAVKEPEPVPPALLAAQQQPPEPEPVIEPVPEGEGQKILSVQRAIKAIAEPTPVLIENVTKYLKNQYAKARHLWIAGNEAGANAVIAQIHQELDDGIALFGILAPDERRAYSSSWKQASRRVGSAVVIDSGDVQAAVDVLAQRCVGIAETTRKEIADAIIAGTQQQWTDAQISAQLADLGFERSKARAPLITRTELATASVTAATDAYAASGVVESLQWITAPTDACPDCLALDGTRANLGADFPGGLMPPAHPSCRCDVLPVLAEGNA